jgi:hypothetical protein
VVPSTADSAPTDNDLTDYGREHLVIYLRLLDSAQDGVDWREVAKIVLDLDPDQHPKRVRECHESHLGRARWLKSHVCPELLRID